MNESTLIAPNFLTDVTFLGQNLNILLDYSLLWEKREKGMKRNDGKREVGEE